MTVETLLGQLEDRGVTFSYEGDRLRFRALKGVITPDERAGLIEHRDAVVATLRTRAEGESSVHPLSHAQQAVWLLQNAAPDSAVNNLAIALRLRAETRQDILAGAAQRVVDRHATLRTTYRSDDAGQLVQMVHGAGTARVTRHDVRELTADAVRARIEADRDAPFDLEHGPMLRVSIYDQAPDDQICLIASHHIASDGLSLLIIARDLLEAMTELATGATRDLEPAPPAYTDFVAAEAARLATPAGEEAWRYWERQLAPPRGMVELPASRPPPPAPSFRGDAIALALDKATSDGVKALAREEGTMAFVVLLASFQMLLARLSGETDVAVGTAFAQRYSEAQHFAVGNYVNALPIRGRMRWTTSFRALIRQLRQATLDALAAQDCPLQLLIKRLHPVRTRMAAPLFNTFFTFQQFPAARDLAALAAGYGEGIDFETLRIEPYWLAHQAGQVDLTLNLADFEDSYRGSLNYATDLFDAPQVETFAGLYQGLVRELVAMPDTTLLPAAEARRVLETFNETDAALDSAPFIVRFAAQARQRPGATAIRCAGETIDYATLDARSDTIAARLRAAGLGRGALVGILADRSIGMVAALLAVQKAGAAYLPLDPAFPDERLAFMAADSGMAAVLSDRGAPAWLADDGPPVLALDAGDDAAGDDDPAAAGWPEPPAPRDLAYLIYTSGSTGTPNAVEIGHGALANLLGAMAIAPGLRADDVLAAVTTVSFDIAALELYLPLLVGATIELVSRETASDGYELADLLATSDATVLQATPATWRLLIESDWSPARGFRALCGGERLPRELAVELLARGVELWNLYGPTETTIWSTAGRVEAADRIDVGRPIANTRIYVLDEGGEPVPAGVDGAVWIGGAGLAAGYRGRPELTADRFRDDPFATRPQARMYRTGDIGHWTEAGRLVIAGRLDDQVKIRGYRVEPGEIEAVLGTHPEVRRVAVVPREIGGETRLVAYCVYATGAEPVTSELRRHVRRSLPDHMIPAIFVELDELPLTANGKIDRRRLPDPLGAGGRTASQVFIEPQPGLEQTLAQIWAELLHVEHVGAHDMFFELGGDSLLTLRAAAALKARTGLALPPRILFFRTLRQVAAVIRDPQLAEAGATG